MALAAHRRSNFSETFKNKEREGGETDRDNEIKNHTVDRFQFLHLAQHYFHC